MMFIAFTLVVLFLSIRPMTGTPYKSLQNWLQPHGEPLNALLGQVQRLRRLTGVLRRALPEPLAAHCVAANLDGDTLVVGCDSSAWAAKLRYHLPTLLARLQDLPETPALSHIRIRVQPLREPPRRAAPRRARLSVHNAELLAAMADGTADPALKAALLRLSRHAPAGQK
jgi:hypothetical protein